MLLLCDFILLFIINLWLLCQLEMWSEKLDIVYEKVPVILHWRRQFIRFLHGLLHQPECQKEGGGARKAVSGNAGRTELYQPLRKLIVLAFCQTLTLCVWGVWREVGLKQAFLTVFLLLLVPLTCVPDSILAATGMPWRRRRNPALMLRGYDQLWAVAGSQPPKAAVAVHLLSFKDFLLSAFL